MRHSMEITVGSEIGANDLNVYRCWHNHCFIVVGPHLFCTCDGQPNVVQAMRPTPWDEDKMLIQRLWCRCLAPTKSKARVRRKLLTVASSAYTLGGLRAVQDIIELELSTPNVNTTYEYKLPTWFPTVQNTRWVSLQR